MDSEQVKPADAGISFEVEDVDEQDINAKVHIKTYLLVVAINLAFAAQFIAVVGSGALALDISAVTGSTQTVWYSTTITIMTGLLSPSVSQAADYWGRKWFIVGLTAMGCIGSIIISRATSQAGVLAGFAVTGLAYGAQAPLQTVSSEVLPRRQRTLAQGIFLIMGLTAGFCAVLYGGALTQNGHHDGFRVYFYISAALFGIAAILSAVLYHPLPRQLEVELRWKQKLAKLDWPAYALLTIGVTLFCVGLSWSQSPYPWSDAHVSAPFAIGLAFILALILYARFVKKDGLLHHRLFQHRNYAIACFCLFVEGLSFFAANSYLPLVTAVLFTSDAVLVGLHFGIAFLSAIVTLSIAAAYSWRFKSVKAPAVVAYVSFVIFFILMATVKVTSSGAAFWAYPIFVGAGFGVATATLTTVAQFASPPSLISTSTGVLLSCRNLGGSVGLPIYNAIFQHELTDNLAPKIAAATLPLGLPQTSLVPFIEALVAGDTTGLAKVPGATLEIIGAAALALKEAYVVSVRSVWITAGAFAVVALIATFFIEDPHAAFNLHVDAPVEGDELVHDRDLDSKIAA